MAAIDYTRPAPFGAITIHRLTDAVWRAGERFTRWREAQRTLRVLRGLSPRQLADLGLEGVSLDDYARRLHNL